MEPAEERTPEEQDDQMEQEIERSQVSGVEDYQYSDEEDAQHFEGVVVELEESSEEESGEEEEDEREDNLQYLLEKFQEEGDQRMPHTSFLGKIKGINFDSEPSTPLSYFSLFLSTRILNFIRNRSNAYAQQKGVTLNTTTEEIKAFLGFHLWTGIVKLSSLNSCFSTKAALDFPFITSRFSRDRVKILYSCIHVQHAEEQPGPLEKVNFFSETIRQKFQQYYTPGAEVVVDEGIVPTKSPKSGFRVFMKAKPHKFGVKIWKLCDKDHYLYNYQIYTGRKGSGGKRVKGLGEQVLTGLIEALPSNQHNIVADNFFSSVSLAEELRKKGFHYTGTINANRSILSALNLRTKLELGETDWKITPEGLMCMTWKDSKLV